MNRDPPKTANLARTPSKVVATVMLVSAVGLLIAALLTEFARHHWFLDLMACLRVQQVIAVVAALAVAGYRRSWVPITCLVLALMIHLRWFGPALPHVSADPIGPTIKISFANVLTSNPQHGEAIATLLRSDPDVFAVIELSHALSDKLCRHTQHRYPNAITRPSDAGSFGIALFSKVPMSDIEVFELDEGIESIAATVQFSDRPIRIFVTHPVPPMGPELSKRRNEHLRRLADRVVDFRKESPETPVVVLGDLNVTPWSPTFYDLTEQTRLRRATNPFNLTPTHYSGPSVFPFGLVIDHALIDESLRCQDYQVGDDFGSDHRCVTVRLN